MVVTEKPVLVTGANGFIASHIVKILFDFIHPFIHSLIL